MRRLAIPTTLLLLLPALITGAYWKSLAQKAGDGAALTFYLPKWPACPLTPEGGTSQL